MSCLCSKRNNQIGSVSVASGEPGEGAREGQYPKLKPTKSERETLEACSRRPKSAQALVQRGRTILLCAGTRTNTEVAAEPCVTKQTSGKWRQRFLDRRPDRLPHEPHPGTPRKLSDPDLERVLALTLESTPADATHLSTRSLAKASRLSRASVHRIWKALRTPASSH